MKKIFNSDKLYKLTNLINFNNTLYRSLWLSEDKPNTKLPILVRKCIYVLIPFAFLLAFGIILINCGVFTNNTDITIRLIDDFANCYALPYVFIFSYFAQGYYTNKQFGIIKNMIKDNKEISIKIERFYKKYNIIATTAVLIISVSFAIYFIKLAQDNDATSNISEWLYLLPPYGIALYYIIVCISWIMSLFLLSDSVCMAHIFMMVSKEKLTYSLEHYDKMLGFRACIKSFISRLSLVIYYMIGTVIIILSDISIKINHDANHFFSTDGVSYFIIIMIAILISYCTINIIPILQYRSLIKSYIDSNATNRKIATLDLRIFNKENILSLLSTAIIPILTLILQIVEYIKDLLAR